MKITHVEDYAKLRREGYPEIGDQLDALWKLIAALPQANNIPEVKSMLQKIEAIKTRFPKQV